MTLMMKTSQKVINLGIQVVLDANGDYQITFSTQGRELKIETTDKIEAGERIGLKWNPEDIHVMRKMG